MRYPARVTIEEKGFSADFINFRNLSARGDTLEELEKNASEILSATIKQFIDQNRRVPVSTSVKGDDILWVQPHIHIIQRMAHKKYCQCPVCRNMRGERPSKRKIGLFVSNEIFESMRDIARERRMSQNRLWEQAAKKFLADC
ncbi:MAG: type II toxin-antitoxin system HicB family antitoxin [Candidatus Eremiobacteraeota bacterium]|nr:type II toxin-antitoxin system HicB family antitoxin [Candidatus Eremiobacteraeota bacterium]